MRSEVGVSRASGLRHEEAQRHHTRRCGWEGKSNKERKYEVRQEGTYRQGWGQLKCRLFGGGKAERITRISTKPRKRE